MCYLNYYNKKSTWLICLFLLGSLLPLHAKSQEGQVKNQTAVTASSMSIVQPASSVYSSHSSETSQEILQDILGEELYNHHPWSILYYYGITYDDPLSHTLTLNIHHVPEHIQSLELAYTLDEENLLRRLFHPIVNVTQLAGNLTFRDGTNQSQIKEFDPYIIFRWTRFPWNRYLITSLALAEGVSYVSSVPVTEKKFNSNTKRLLNYLMFEVTFSLPNQPRLQGVIRIHHRSGAFGLYQAGNSGSNDIGLGIRYLF